MLRDVHQNAIAHSLAGKARPGRAKRHRDSVQLREFEQGLDFANRIRLDHGLRYEPKIRRVVGIRNAVDQPGVDAGGGDDLRELRLEIHASVSALILHAFIWETKMDSVPLTDHGSLPLRISGLSSLHHTNRYYFLPCSCSSSEISAFPVIIQSITCPTTVRNSS
jgi:hypothetical protein